MPQPAGPLQGQKVAFTGRLASMTRARAANLIQEHGGTWVPSVTRHTSLLVVGQDGWPLDKNGQLTRKLQKAQQLPLLSILTEADLLDRLGLDSEQLGR